MLVSTRRRSARARDRAVPRQRIAAAVAAAVAWLSLLLMSLRKGRSLNYRFAAATALPAVAPVADGVYADGGGGVSCANMGVA